MQNLRTRIDHPDTTPSAQVLSAMREQGGLSNYALNLAKQHTASLQAQVLDAASQARFSASIEASWQKQQQLEAQEQGSFEDFVANYYA
jgi:glutamate--cysteine ligase